MDVRQEEGNGFTKWSRSTQSEPLQYSLASLSSLRFLSLSLSLNPNIFGTLLSPSIFRVSEDLSRK
ncbi:hypothetical protein Ahy_B03g062339 [Arachis hypogaea]|uniref:Uncharacterized protein n=1 Tax=Arachis hypogaea TaxID=3818 RepID=A0A444ZTZ4_ARAHY|nr:hypothetical protein Ahy_B03g062339 [Arachis hypogaea]